MHKLSKIRSWQHVCKYVDSQNGCVDAIRSIARDPSMEDGQ